MTSLAKSVRAWLNSFAKSSGIFQKLMLVGESTQKSISLFLKAYACRRKPAKKLKPFPETLCL